MSWLLLGVAGLSFLVGRRAISEFAKTDRLLAEMEGMGIALEFGVLGFMAKAAGERLSEAEEDETSTSEEESLRK